MSSDVRCMNCMEEKGASEPCPHCGVGQLAPDPLGRSLQPGTVIGGKYLLGRVLGQGGFGITYLAWDDMLQRKLAIKEYMPREIATRGADGFTVMPYAGEEEKHFERGRKKFLAEGQVLVKFQHHPGIVSSFDYLEAHGTAYLVMEYLDGRDFETFLRDAGGRLDPQMATMVMVQVMDALRALHGEGLVHRDVSPDNIYITHSNQVKLLDFGLARHALRHSLSIEVIVKPGYSPVEQYAQNGQIGFWTDVYATAATLYRALVGEPPPGSIERMSKDQLVPPSARGIALPAAAEQALLAALAVEPANRLGTIEELQGPLLTLGGVVADEPIPGPAQNPGDSSSVGTPVVDGATEWVMSRPANSSPGGASLESSTVRVESQPVPNPVTEEVLTGRPVESSWPLSPTPTPGQTPHPAPGPGVESATGPGKASGLAGGAIFANRRVQLAAAAVLVVLLVLGVLWTTGGSSSDEESTTGTLVVRIDRAAYASVDGFRTPDGGQSKSRRHVFSELTPGSHQLKVWLDGYEEERRRVSIDVGEEFEVSLELKSR